MEAGDVILPPLFVRDDARCDAVLAGSRPDVNVPEKSRLPPTALAFLALLLLGTVLEAIVPLLLGAVLDAALTDARQSLLLFVVLAAAMCLAIACNVSRHVVGGRWKIQRQTDLRTRLGDTIFGDIEAVSSSVGASHIGTVLGSDISRIAGYPIALMRWVSALVGLVVVAIYLLWLSVPLALLVLVGVPVFMWITQLASRPLESRQEHLRDRVGRISEMSSDIALGLRTLWAVGARGAFLERIHRENREAQRAGLRLANSEAVLLSVGVLLPGVLLVGLVGIGGVLLERGVLSPAALVTFYAASAYLVGPLQTTATVLQLRASARVARRRLAEIEVPVEPAGRNHGSPLTGVPVATELTVIRPGSRATFDDTARDVVDQINRSGEQGRTRVQYENPAVFSGSVRELIDPMNTADDPTILSSIHTAAADDVIDRFEHGLDEVVGAGGRRLSGGQRQRLVLARSLLGRPQVLVLVRPTSALDVATESTVAERVTRERTGATTVVLIDSAAFDEGAASVVELGDAK